MLKNCGKKVQEFTLRKKNTGEYLLLVFCILRELLIDYAAVEFKRLFERMI